MSGATVDVVASFPAGYFLENLVMRADRSFLVTVLNHRELWYVPPVDDGTSPEPVRLQTFEQNVLGIAETEPDVFMIAGTNFYTTHECYLYRLDLTGWRPGDPVRAGIVHRFPAAARGLNGMCTIAPGVLLVADCFAGRIWRVDVADDGTITSRTWLRHPSMDHFPGAMKPEQPGVNGVRLAARTSYLYYTATAKKLLMRVHVNPWSLEPDGEPELVVAGRMGDDFCVDDDAGCLYVTTHRQNTIDRVAMDPAVNSGFTDSIAGDPFDPRLVGPSALVWDRERPGRVIYGLTDGGTASPEPGGPTPAHLVRLRLADDATRRRTR